MHKFRFGDMRALCEALTDLVLCGKKTCTCWPNREVKTGEPMLRTGDRAIYTDWDGKDVCMVEITNIQILPFNEVPDSFALSEGENDSRDG